MISRRSAVASERFSPAPMQIVGVAVQQSSNDLGIWVLLKISVIACSSSATLATCASSVRTGRRQLDRWDQAAPRAPVECWCSSTRYTADGAHASSGWTCRIGAEQTDAVEAFEAADGERMRPRQLSEADPEAAQPPTLLHEFVDVDVVLRVPTGSE